MGRHMMTGPACSKQHVVTPGTQISAPQMRVASAAASMISTNSHCPEGGPPQQPDTCEVMTTTANTAEPRPTSDATKRANRAMLGLMRSIVPQVGWSIPSDEEGA